MKKKENLLFVSWATSVIATLSSLYFSEILHLEPCALCWYQRIAMYPLTVILGVAIVKKQYWISYYALYLSAIGLFLAIYHYFIQKIPLLKENSIACGRVSCTEDYINIFGFITIPFLSIICFALIFILNFILWRQERNK